LGRGGILRAQVRRADGGGDRNGQKVFDSHLDDLDEFHPYKGNSHPRRSRRAGLGPLRFVNAAMFRPRAISSIVVIHPPVDTMAPVRWIKVATFGTGFEADAAKARLEAEGIPALIRGNGAGIFGAAFQGPVIGGVDLSVPREMRTRAERILADL